jgi:hypothetical protein
MENKTTITTFELQPVNNRKSFYWKAEVIRESNILKLRSYQTIVAQVDLDTNTLFINGRYSKTTAEHINSFLLYLWQNTATKKEIGNRPTEGKVL